MAAHPEQARLLVVDDEKSMREFLEIVLRKAGYLVEVSSSVSQACAALERAQFDLVISDLKLGAESGLDLLGWIGSHRYPAEVLLITAFATTETAIQAMKLGAYDYLQKPFKNEELLIVCQRALERRRLLQENTSLRQQLSHDLLLGESGAISEVRSVVEKVAPTRTTVLLQGESGTGKELVAKLLHHRSGRQGAFVAMNCGAVPADLLESELFGHVKGAFTGAVSTSTGLFRAAAAGTLFLDEIGELPLPMQVKLLRVLQERTIRPVGGTESTAIDVRIVAATNRDLEQEVGAGRFREDLYYRLNVVQIRIPPLRDRRDDIIPLMRVFLERMRQELGRPLLTMSPAAEALVATYSFPGNVREFENLVERAAALSDQDEIVVEVLPLKVRGVDAPQSVGRLTKPEIPVEGLDMEGYLDEIERALLTDALKRSAGNRTEAAHLLKLSFRSFRYRLAKLGIRD